MGGLGEWAANGCGWRGASGGASNVLLYMTGTARTLLRMGGPSRGFGRGSMGGIWAIEYVSNFKMDGKAAAWKKLGQNFEEA